MEGVKIAIEDVNKEGGVDGREVKLLFRDDQFKWDQTTTHALDLIDNHRVDFIAGSMVGPEEVRLNEFSRKRNIIYANYPQHIMSTPGNAKKMSPLFFTANTTPYQLWREFSHVYRQEQFRQKDPLCVRRLHLAQDVHPRILTS